MLTMYDTFPYCFKKFEDNYFKINCKHEGIEGLFEYYYTFPRHVSLNSRYETIKKRIEAVVPNFVTDWTNQRGLYLSY